MKNFTLAVALLITFSVQSQIGMGTPNPDPSAVLELASTQKGFLPPRLTTLERDAIVQPAKGLTIYNTDKDCLEWYNKSGWYNACGDNGVAVVANYTCNTLETGTMEVGIPVSGVSQTITANVTKTGSYSITTNTVNGVTFSASGTFSATGSQNIVLTATGTPITMGLHNFILNTTSGCNFDRTTILTVKSSTGKIWMAYNLGATAQATSMNDAAQYGDYYQWGRGTDGHEKKNPTMTTTRSVTDDPRHGDFIKTKSNWRSPANTNLWQGVYGINNPCPSGFRIPTMKEWEEEFNKLGIKDNATAFNSVLKLTTTGYLVNYLGIYSELGTNSNYWSSTSSGDNTSFIHLGSISYRYDTLDHVQANGFSVRCIKD